MRRTIVGPLPAFSVSHVLLAACSPLRLLSRPSDKALEGSWGRGSRQGEPRQRLRSFDPADANPFLPFNSYFDEVLATLRSVLSHEHCHGSGSSELTSNTVYRGGFKPRNDKVKGIRIGIHIMKMLYPPPIQTVLPTVTPT
jgi:hypothetical protein